MATYRSLMRVELGPQYVPTGKTKHYLGSPDGRQEFPAFKSLEIAQYPEDTGFYLLYYSAAGPGTDTWHETVENAMHQAEFEFGVKSNDWIKADGEIK